MHRTIAQLLVPALLALAGCGTSPSTPTADEPPRLFDDLGALQRSIGTSDAQAQRYFDQGLRLVYAFNHQAAIDSFAQAVKLDPNCAACYWGQALALGPNVNLPMLPEAVQPAFELSRKALALADKAAPADRALIHALTVRYAAEPPADRRPLDLAYAQAMAEVVRQFPDDLDAAVLYAEALMDLSPWAYWDRDGQPGEHTPALVAALESVLARDPDHIGAIHYYIHAVEASNEPARAEPYADRLAALSPGAGHLVHMPAHIYIRVGRYHDASLNNLQATQADQRFLAFCRGSNGVYPLGYVPHNWHFLAMSAGLEGNAERSLHAAQQTAQRADRALLDQPGMSFLQAFVVTPLQAQIRFGRWNEILATAEPPAPQTFPRATWHYARGLAYIARRDLDAAAGELTALETLAADPALKETYVSSVNTAAPVAQIAVATLRGELAAARGDVDAAVASLRAAVATESTLTYMEPPDWALPVRHNLGAVLLDAGRAAEAEAVYREDLRVFPENGWSLRGLEQALRAQARAGEADAVKARFDTAWQWADTPISASRM